MTDHQEPDSTDKRANPIWPSQVNRDRFDRLTAEMEADLGRRVTQNEVLERLFANQWGDKP
jgi:hypothetical protein